MKNKIALFARRRDCKYAFDSQKNGMLFSALGGDLIPAATDQLNSEKSWFENRNLFENYLCTYEAGVFFINTQGAYIKYPVNFSAAEQTFTIAGSVWLDEETTTDSVIFCAGKSQNTTAGDSAFIMSYQAENKKIVFSMYDSNNVKSEVISTSTFATGWHTFVVSSAVANNMTSVVIYADGALVANSDFNLENFSGILQTISENNFCMSGNINAASQAIKIKQILVFDKAFNESQAKALMNALTVYPDVPDETGPTYSATLDTVFRNPNDYVKTTQENPVHIVPDPGKTIYYQVSAGSNIIYLDFSAYTTVRVNCSGFTKINDKLYSITGSFFPWITGNNNTLTSIIINQD